jgi:hypothetical protein
VLERVAPHKVRLRVPGIGPDARGVALGSRGLVLFPSIERFLVFMSAYSAENVFDAFAASLRVEIVRSPLGLREVAFSFDAGGTDRMDRVAEVARLASGLTFTGTSRHFVEYRSRAAPFGWDATEIVATAAPLVLYHSTFTQAYEIERTLELRRLLLRLELRRARPVAGDGPRFLLAEGGIGPPLARHLVAADVRARVAVIEWSPEVGLDREPVRRWLFQLESLPRRLRALSRTPGITCFVEAAPRALVEEGFEHPILLRALPLFSEGPYALFRGDGRDALEAPESLAWCELRSFVRPTVRGESGAVPARAIEPPSLEVPVRLSSSAPGAARATASFVPSDELPLLRRLAYALPARVLRAARVAFVEAGAYVVASGGADVVPLGHFFRSVTGRVFAPLAMEIVPRVSPGVLEGALAAAGDAVFFFRADGRLVALDAGAFVPLESALLEGAVWAPLAARTIDVEEPLPPVVSLEPLGVRPLRGVERE